MPDEAGVNGIQVKENRILRFVVRVLHLSITQKVASVVSIAQKVGYAGQGERVEADKLFHLHFNDSPQEGSRQRVTFQSGRCRSSLTRSLSNSWYHDFEQQREGSRQFPFSRSNNPIAWIHEGQCLCNQPSSEHAKKQRIHRGNRSHSELREICPCLVLAKPEVVSCNSAAPYQRQARESTENCDRTGRGVLCGSMADSCGGQFISGEKEALYEL